MSIGVIEIDFHLSLGYHDAPDIAEFVRAHRYFRTIDDTFDPRELQGQRRSPGTLQEERERIVHQREPPAFQLHAIDIPTPRKIRAPVVPFRASFPTGRRECGN